MSDPIHLERYLNESAYRDGYDKAVEDCRFIYLVKYSDPDSYHSHGVIQAICGSYDACVLWLKTARLGYRIEEWDVENGGKKTREMDCRELGKWVPAR